MTSTAYLLVSHGSRDPRHQSAINRLAQLVRERLSPSSSDSWNVQSLNTGSGERNSSGLVALGQDIYPQKTRRNGLMGAVMTAAPVAKKPVRLSQDVCIVGTAVLEFGLLPLHQQICNFGRRLGAAGVKRLKIVPLFLLQGRHVADDIPEEVELAREQLKDIVTVDIEPHIGGAQTMQALIATRFGHAPVCGRLLVAHGSRRPKGNRPVDELAKSLGTPVAYWTIESDIESQAIQLMQQGCSQLTIFPYFLFAGGITDAVAHLTEELAERFPRTRFRLLPPLGATGDIANLIVSSLGHRVNSSSRARG